MNIVFGSDHAGFAMREALRAFAAAAGHCAWSVGATSEAAYDYPDAADLGVADVLSGKAQRAVLVCGTGIGMSIRANRHPGIRAANCCNEAMAELARRHNHANVLCVGARVLDIPAAEAILARFLDTGEDTEARHVRRVEELDRALREQSKESGCLG